MFQSFSENLILMVNNICKGRNKIGIVNITQTYDPVIIVNVLPPDDKHKNLRFDFPVDNTTFYPSPNIIRVGKHKILNDDYLDIEDNIKNLRKLTKFQKQYLTDHPDKQYQVICLYGHVVSKLIKSI